LSLPAPLAWQTLQTVGLPILLAFPLLTLLMGKVLTSQDAEIQSVAALRKSEAQHRVILQTAMNGFWMADLQGRLLEVNQAYVRMSGYSVQELLGMRITELEALRSSTEIATHIQKIMATGGDRFETQHRGKDGKVFDVEVSIQYLAIESGRLVAFLRDITERKQAEQALQESKALTEAIVENLPLMVFLKREADLRFVLFNRAGEALLGHDRQDMIGKNDLDFFSGRAGCAVHATGPRGAAR
jgi:PAS domain S-box-containing protein